MTKLLTISRRMVLIASLILGAISCRYLLNLSDADTLLIFFMLLGSYSLGRSTYIVLNWLRKRT